MVDGPLGQRRSALNVALNDLEAVHVLNPEIGAKALVPLPDQSELHVSYEHLLRLEERYGPDHEFDPEDADRSYTVRELLEGVRFDRTAADDRLRPIDRGSRNHRREPVREQSTPSSGAKRIFLAHANEDKPEVRQLYDDLKARDLRPWLDEEDLIPGQNWREVIPKIINQSGVFVACLSSRSVEKTGFVNSELRLALSASAERPVGSIYVIPVRLDECDVPDLQLAELGLRLTDTHRVDLWQTGGFDRLVSAIEHALGGATRAHAS